MDGNLLDQFKQLEKQVEVNKTEKVRLEERLKTLEEEHTRLLVDLTTLNVTEDNLEAEILKLTNESQTELNKFKEQLNA